MLPGGRGVTVRNGLCAQESKHRLKLCAAGKSYATLLEKEAQKILVCARHDAPALPDLSLADLVSDAVPSRESACPSRMASRYAPLGACCQLPELGRNS